MCHFCHKRGHWIAVVALFQSVLSPREVKNYAQGYVIQNKVLCKWVPHGEGGVGDPVYQVVMPATFRDRG